MHSFGDMFVSKQFGNGTQPELRVCCGRCLGCDDAGQTLGQMRGVGVQHVPHDVVVHAVVAVNETVAHSGDFTLGDFGMAFAQLGRKPGGGCTHQFNGAFGGELVFPVGVELFATAFAA